MAVTVYVVGAGLSGLSTAAQLVKAGHNVKLFEAANHAGGRCRSYFDRTLDHRIDNGNHLVLSGNRAVAEYLDLVGAKDSLSGPERAEFPFVDLKSGEKWTVRPDRGVIPWSLLSTSNRVPGSSLGEYLKGFNLCLAGPDKTVQACLDHQGPLYRRFWEPLAVSVLNTDPKEAAAQLLWPVLRETFGRGEKACRPLIARIGLSESFIDPALSHLEKRAAGVSFGTRLKAIGYGDRRVTSLEFTDRRVDITDSDRVVLALPPYGAEELVAGLAAPDEFRAIVNAHFKLPESSHLQTSFVGLVGGVGHWLFVRDGIASVTISAAERFVDMAAEELAEILWPEITLALGLGEAAIGAHRIVKEKRATFAQTPKQITRRSGPETGWKNLFVAGDWTDTGLPATIEGSLLSGKRAVKSVLESL